MERWLLAEARPIQENSECFIVENNVITLLISL